MKFLQIDSKTMLTQHLQVISGIKMVCLAYVYECIIKTWNKIWGIIYSQNVLWQKKSTEAPLRITSLDRGHCQRDWSVTPAVSSKEPSCMRYLNIIKSQNLNVQKQRKKKKKHCKQSQSKAFWCSWWNINEVLLLQPSAGSKQRAQGSINTTEQSGHFAGGIWRPEIQGEANFAALSLSEDG